MRPIKYLLSVLLLSTLSFATACSDDAPAQPAVAGAAGQSGQGGSNLSGSSGQANAGQSGSAGSAQGGAGQGGAGQGGAGQGGAGQGGAGMSGASGESGASGQSGAGQGGAGQSGSAGQSGGGQGGSGPKGVLAILSNPAPDIDPPDYAKVLALVNEAGARGSIIAHLWSELEPTQGDYQLDSLKNTLDVYANELGHQVYLNVQAINTTTKEVPAELKDQPWDGALMKERFHALIDKLVPIVEGRIAYLSIGNEVDVYLNTTSEWDTYRDFYEDGAAYVRARLPGVKVGVCTTYGIETPPFASKIQQLNAKSDIYITTYYPLGEGLKPLGPKASDFDGMIALGGGLPVVIQELGYPSAALLDSSEQEQAEFFQDSLAQWRDRWQAIPFLNIFLLHDLPEPLCKELANYYGVPGNAPFEAYLCSLGLRKTDGSPKAAWKAVVSASQQAGLP
jgi:hypothetical protein